MQFVIISGMSGAGKSKAASDLEDLGFYCVDNMPAEMIPQFAQLCLATKGRYEKVALVTDVRASMTFDALFQALQKLDEMHLQYSIYYIEASTEVIIVQFLTNIFQNLKKLSLMSGIQILKLPFKYLQKNIRVTVIDRAILIFTQLAEVSISYSGEMNHCRHLHPCGF